MSGNSQNITAPQGKAFHAKRLFNRWRHYKNKKCFSSRQGTTFITQYQANSYNNIVNKGQGYIYKKLYSNLDHNFSTNPSTKCQQEKHFERNCRHVDYDFPIPTLPLPVIPVPIEEEPQPPAPTFSVDLSMIPDDLLAYILDHPVYKGDIHNQLTDKQKAKLQPLQVGKKAKLWNTSFDVINQRLILAAQLTTLQDLQGEKASIEQDILMIPLTSNRNKKNTPYYITEEERALEVRPNKRTVNINCNLDSLLSLHPVKRVCISDLPASRIITSSTLSG
ncbi:hypothetical protein C1646_764710 [Rhizophagus diaphanus]|nr:hypothetical protein C1646_764710 [Rhizophagus diaphanus] [Rhizophagus sp. MUCL 43196]